MRELHKQFYVLYEKNEGLKNLETKYNEAREKYKLPYNFEGLLLILDYIYCVDLMAYKDNPDKHVILSGKETESAYEIHPGKNYKLSLQYQRKYMNGFDIDNFLALADNGGNFRDFGRFVVDGDKRKLITQFMNTYTPQNQEEPHKKK